MSIKAAVAKILKDLGYDRYHDPETEDTSRRVADFWRDWHRETESMPPKMSLFDGPDVMTMIEIGPFPFHSMCAHHMLPFFGTVTVKYGTRGKVIGLSKVPRLVDWCAHRLTKQEDLTDAIAERISPYAPGGVEVTTEAEHMCMSMRGVQKPGTITRVTARRGPHE